MVFFSSYFAGAALVGTYAGDEVEVVVGAATFADDATVVSYLSLFLFFLLPILNVNEIFYIW